MSINSYQNIYTNNFINCIISYNKNYNKNSTKIGKYFDNSDYMKIFWLIIQDLPTTRFDPCILYFQMPEQNHKNVRVTSVF